MASVTLGMCMQLKGCNSEVFYHHGPVTGGSADDGKLQMVWWTLAEWLSTPAQCSFGGLMMQGTLRDGAVHWIWDDVCCIFFLLALDQWCGVAMEGFNNLPYDMRHG